MSAGKVDVLAVLRRAANLADTTGDRLGNDNPPGHCDYINKKGASANCKQVAVDIEGARDAVLELLDSEKEWSDATEAWEALPAPDGIYDNRCNSDEFKRFQAACARKKAALANVGVQW